MGESRTLEGYPAGHLTLDRNEVMVGDSIIGSVTVPPEQAKLPGAEISLGYKITHFPPKISGYGPDSTRTVVSGHRRTSVVNVASEYFGSDSFESAESGWHQCFFEFPVPAEGPPSAVVGENRTAWYVRALVGEVTLQAPLTVISTRDTYAAWTDGTQHRIAPLFLVSRPEVALSPGPAPRFDEGEGPCHMELRLPRLYARPGETLEGMLVLEARSRVKARGVRVDLESWLIEKVGELSSGLFVWREITGHSVSLTGRTELAGGDRKDLPFRIQIPADAPPSFTTPHTDLHWFLVGVVDRRLRSDPVVSVELNVHGAKRTGSSEV